VRRKRRAGTGQGKATTNSNHIAYDLMHLLCGVWARRRRDVERTIIMMDLKRRQLENSLKRNELLSLRKQRLQATTTKRHTASKHDRANAKCQRALDQEMFWEASNFLLSGILQPHTQLYSHLVSYGRTRQIKNALGCARPLLSLAACTHHVFITGLRFMTFGQQRA